MLCNVCCILCYIHIYKCYLCWYTTLLVSISTSSTQLKRIQTPHSLFCKCQELMRIFFLHVKFGWISQEQLTDQSCAHHLAQSFCHSMISRYGPEISDFVAHLGRLHKLQKPLPCENHTRFTCNYCMAVYFATSATCKYVWHKSDASGPRLLVTEQK